MKFLTKKDFDAKITSEKLDIITETDDSVIDTVELDVIKEITSYISNRYDAETIFKSYTEHVPTPPDGTFTPYPVGALIYDAENDLFYTVLLANAGEDFSVIEQYKPGDTRDTLIRRFTVDIVLYELYCRIKPRFIPEFRIQRRDDAIKWLRDVQNPRNNINADWLPKVPEEPRKGLDISWNSRPKQYNKY